MKTDMRPIDSITPYEKNPRKNAGAIAAVAKSIEEFGFRQPIVVDEQGVIIVGHTRWKAAQQLGMTEVPVHIAVGMPPEKAKAYRIADNQTATIADFDKELLGIELGELKAIDFRPRAAWVRARSTPGVDGERDDGGAGGSGRRARPPERGDHEAGRPDHSR